MSLTTHPESYHTYLFFRPLWRVAALTVILTLALFLRLVAIERVGDGNTYYTAAVASMLQSSSNFFFAAAEPGGSVSVDKPPLGLWIQAFSALLFGVSGVSVTLPQIVAGVLSVLLLYHIVGRRFGVRAGLIAALALAVMPVTIAADRNNTMDSLLILTLILAAWAFLRATETGKLRPLLVGALLVGIGFNIKMLQAYLILPALYSLYLCGASVGVRRKVLSLALASVVLVGSSLAWIIVVELTPAAQRPYVGSSQTNSALELAIGYNGLQRLLGMDLGGRGGTIRQFPPPNGGSGGAAPVPPLGGGGRMGGMFGGEVGSPGVLRFFQPELANEISWLLPLGFGLGLLLLIGERPRRPLTNTHRALILWGGWLVTGIVFFSVSEFFHAYYLATLSPALAALLGIGLSRLYERAQTRQWLTVMLIALCLGTLLYQIAAAMSYGLPLPVLLIGLVGVIVLFVLSGLWLAWRPSFGAGLAAALMAAVFAIPTAWGALTALDPQVNNVLPSAYAGGRGGGGSMVAFGGGNPPSLPAGGLPAGGGFSDRMGEVNAEMLAYLEEHTTKTKYLVAVSSAMTGAPLVLETHRPVLYLGGFTGSDPIHSAESIAALVKAGDLRYVLASGMPMGGAGGEGDQGVMAWVGANCQRVEGLTTTPNLIGIGATLLGMGGGITPGLYACGG
ncbi:MAG TPA: glycosyltransferase family 39 protein [Aggregatilineales bacterium]|nr:glycosyltransferase family 39 protein [Anaerolineales bacterium]HRE46287.1 glycosyltransferase family 39 protein [Aggregatilineales bacterium]